VHVSWISAGIAFNPVSRRKKSVEPLDERWVGMKQCGYAVNDAWCIDCLSLEFFHHIQEAVVNVWLVRELNLHVERERNIITSAHIHSSA
jgi:hypothetical protein